ncbi:unnamed protein product [Trifolium pratense]|uniref:Uncharacterized protein n=1 Tax=Trifolium pratense TaxID=57577 RepID=A0ACB0L843_TRIPR|nr:unnamed protein product [Trifolium pratense]
MMLLIVSSGRTLRTGCYQLVMLTSISKATTCLLATLIWCNFIPPSCSFLMWRIIHNRMPTDDNLRSRGCVLVSVCALCLHAYETTRHLFFDCQFARSIWVWLEGKLRCKFDFSSPVDMLLRCLSAVRLLLRDIALADILHTIHTIWMARNGIKLNNANISLHPTLIKINTAILLTAGLSNNSCWPDSIALQVMRDLQVFPKHRPPP